MQITDASAIKIAGDDDSDVRREMIGKFLEDIRLMFDKGGELIATAIRMQ